MKNRTESLKPVKAVILTNLKREKPFRLGFSLLICIHLVSSVYS